MEELRELVAIAQYAGLQIDDLSAFLREKRARQRSELQLQAEAQRQCINAENPSVKTTRDVNTKVQTRT